MTNDNDQFTDDAWNDDETDDDGPGEFVQHVEEIREQRDEREQEQNDTEDDTDEGLDAVVERLSGRVYRVKYPDPADPDDTERETIVADTIQPTAAGMAFSKNGGESAHVYPAPVDIKRLDDDAVRSWAKSKRRVAKILKPIAKAFGGGGG